jgi:hypothetical protein
MTNKTIQLTKICVLSPMGDIFYWAIFFDFGRLLLSDKITLLLGDHLSQITSIAVRFGKKFN